MPGQKSFPWGSGIGELAHGLMEWSPRSSIWSTASLDASLPWLVLAPHAMWSTLEISLPRLGEFRIVPSQNESALLHSHQEVRTRVSIGAGGGGIT